MIVVPAVDVRGGKVVRLKQGRLQDETVYGADPAEAARRWESEGAKRLHVVDLDAAIDGKPQPDVIEALIRAVSIPVEVGGGLRVLENAVRYRDRGADRVIFGTAAVARPGVVQEALRLWPEAVAVAIDARDGMVAVAGWKETSRVEATELGRQVRDWGVRRIQYTDIRRDGTLRGPNVEGTRAMAQQTGVPITLSGGISALEDFTAAAQLIGDGVDEVIVGRALYDERFTLAEATHALEAATEEG
jgi:phosphoribosylformimino-5-aminoimidazole carboxamide ribotide isomerase